MLNLCKQEQKVHHLQIPNRESCHDCIVHLRLDLEKFLSAGFNIAITSPDFLHALCTFRADVEFETRMLLYNLDGRMIAVMVSQRRSIPEQCTLDEASHDIELFSELQ